MKGFDFDFLKITPTDVIDIIFVALLIYYVYSLIKNTLAVNLLLGMLIILLLYYVVDALHMRLLSTIINKFMSVGIIALIVIFQPEIRRFLLLIGKNTFLQKNKAWWGYLFGNKEIERDNLARIKPIIDACKSMKKSRTGALIVFVKFYDDQLFANSCEIIDSKISKRLLESIFQKNSPLHDGAVVIAENKIKSASCILPLTDNDNLPPQFGLRHRAGIGISENTDAVAVIVSEETGEIAYAKQGRVRMNVSFGELEKLLNKDF
ncbi:MULTISPECIES: diadenylate cyclase CdaA [Pedobacter]|jgi:diadenylate cyclase|uniref:diadenylate cyclase CdaA n=1 Tax=Pedobacter TaxID=84567 RepID=UPI000D3CC23A|nr:MULTISPECIES: diadenylate cyclase CdaA [Pedobacter]PTS98087.1 TIGR00159 family protein [Pedobacter sp. HMWF019]HWW40661.1 diadenylate cyclase CdaA [Pedobacter sp.]